ncbi:MAG: inositol 2-dehydrogenase [Roseovarius sp.]|nr:inositol 2-dehydrogenase [Roseovarius sp.]MCY4206564.1 inositol 2-dehydrogenase [Roseovarius sp.]
MIKIAVLGCGRIGRMHAENIHHHPRATLSGVYDINRGASKEVADELGVAEYEKAEDVFQSEDVDAVLIASSTPTHADFIERAVKARKPVLCEKPIDLSLDRARVCADAIRGTDVPIMIGFARRFDKGHAAVRNAIESGEIGEVHQVVITSRDPDIAPDSYLRESGGIFRDMSIHDFDLARYIMGEEFETVSAAGARFVSPRLMEECGDYDTVTATMTTGSGRQCVILNSRRAVYGYDQRVEAFGSAGMAVSENRTEHNARIYASNYTGKAAPLLNFFIERYSQAFISEISAFVDSVAYGTRPPVGLEDGVEAILLAEAAMLSVREGRLVHKGELG